MSFAERLAEKLAENKMSKSQLAFELGCSAQCVRNWTNGKVEPRISTIFAVADVLKCDAKWLETGEKPVEDKELKRNASGAYDPTAYNAIKNITEGERTELMDVKRGDVFFVLKTGTNTGDEMEDGRPAVIVSNDTGNKHSGIVEVVFLTTKPKKSLPTHTSVLCRTMSTALCEQVQTISKERLGSYVRTCTDVEMSRIDNALMISLGIEETETAMGAEMNKALNEKVETQKGYIEELEERLDEAKETIKVLEEYNKETHNSTDLIRLEIERDSYKKMCDELLNRLMTK